MPAWIKSVATVFFSAILHVTILLMIIGFPMPDFFGSKESVHSRFREFRQQEAAMPAACPGPLTDNLTPVAPSQTTITSLPAKAAAAASEQPAKITQRKRAKAKIAPKAEEPVTEEAATTEKTEPDAPEQKESKVVDVNFAEKAKPADSAKADDSEKAAESDKTATETTTAAAPAAETEPAKTAEQVPADPTPEKAEPAKTEQPAAATAEEPQKSEEKAEVKEEKPEAQAEQPAPAKNTAEVAEKPAEPKKEEIAAPKETGEETIPVQVQDKIAGVQPANDNESSTEAASEDLNAPPPETEATGESN